MRARSHIAQVGVGVNSGWLALLRRAGWRFVRTQPGTDGWQSWGELPGRRPFSLIVSQATEADGNDWLHASLYLGEDELPTYDDLAALHRAIYGRKRWAYQVFAPEAEHVGITNALHLWGRVDGAPMLPDFTRGLRRI